MRKSVVVAAPPLISAILKKSESTIVKRPFKEWERGPRWVHLRKHEIEQWYQEEQVRMSK
jgi:hypothetical protein